MAAVAARIHGPMAELDHDYEIVAFDGDDYRIWQCIGPTSGAWVGGHFVTFEEALAFFVNFLNNGEKQQ